MFKAEMVRAIIAGRKNQTRRLILRPERFSNIRECTFLCPHGVVGDRIWVKEIYGISGNGPFYKATDVDGTVHHSWFSAMFMKRIYSRITLEITQVRVQCLQEISEADCVAEGINIATEGTRCAEFGMGQRIYRELWNEINGKKAPWISNPWVWALTFKKVDQES